MRRLHVRKVRPLRLAHLAVSGKRTHTKEAQTQRLHSQHGFEMGIVLIQPLQRLVEPGLQLFPMGMLGGQIDADHRLAILKLFPRHPVLVRDTEALQGLPDDPLVQPAKAADVNDAVRPGLKDHLRQAHVRLVVLKGHDLDQIPRPVADEDAPVEVGKNNFVSLTHFQLVHEECGRFVRRIIEASERVLLRNELEKAYIRRKGHSFAVPGLHGQETTELCDAVELEWVYLPVMLDLVAKSGYVHPGAQKGLGVPHISGHHRPARSLGSDHGPDHPTGRRRVKERLQ